jgi:hypothetical protein
MNFWRISNFLTHDDLGPGWTLVGQDRDLKIYRNLSVLPEVFALGKKDFERPVPEHPVLPLDSRTGIDRASARFDLKEESVAVFPGPYDSGWKVFCSDGQRHSAFAVRDYFEGVVLPSGEHRLALVYDPWTWKAGLLLTLCSVLALSVLFLRKLKCYDVSLK